MRAGGIEADLVAIAAPVPAWRGAVDREVWRDAPGKVKAGGGRLVSLWGSDRRSLDGRHAVNAAYAVREGLVWLALPLDEGETYPSLAADCPPAARMERAVRDLSGLEAEAEAAADRRPWLRHDRWPADYFPLRAEASGAERFDALPSAPYAFVPVEGEGVHEIAVGPVHAGIIEPGHFRFSVVGEKVLRLEEKLGYTHKGVEKRFEGTPPAEGHRLAGRVCGDSTVANAWAYCMALEAAASCTPPPRAVWLRALLLERERVANHLGDLGALGNDAAFGFGLAQFSRLKEDWLRLSKDVFGHRYLMDLVVPGGVAAAPSPTALRQLAAQCDAVEQEVRVLQGIYDEHAGLQDRFVTTGRVAPPLAYQLGLCGLGGRASAQAYDLRADYPQAPYAELDFRIATHRNGDVAARVAVRFDETYESLRLIRRIVAAMPAGEHRAGIGAPAPAEFGCGWVEGWRGDIFVALELGADGAIRRCHWHDPSWQNWPVLEHAVMGNIVPDFPLINKSFNLSYSGHDL